MLVRISASPYPPLSTIMRTLLSCYPVVLLYGLVVTLKLAGTDWGTDLPGMHAGIGAVFLLFGASICHLVFVCQLKTGQQSYRLPQSFWIVGTLAFLMMFFDSSFGVHERYAPILGVPESSFLLVYALMLNWIVLINIKKVGVPFLLFFGAFGLASVGALAGDMSAAHEGLFMWNGIAYSFEQALETLGCLLLACAFGNAAMRSLAFQPVVPVNQAAVPDESSNAGPSPLRLVA